MNLAQFITDYGYLALAIGCLLEGETILLLAGFAAHRGLLAWPMVMAVALVFSVIGDQIWFFIGRRYGSRLIARFAVLRRRMPAVRRRLDAHPDLLVLSVRFLVGLRTIGPIVIGCSAISLRRFFVLNLLGALLWATVFVSGGYFFGQLLEIYLPKIHTAEEWALAGLLLAGLVIQLWRLHREKSRNS